MKFSKMALAAIVVVILFFAVSHYTRKPADQDAEKGTTSETTVTENAENSNEWVGTYRGFLPCASCEGILTTVVLKEDNTFQKHDVYLGEKDGMFNEEGSFAVEEDGTKIVLTQNDEKISYRLGDGVITMLDSDGNENTGEFAEMYKLKKLPDDEIEFTDAPVVGILTIGEDVSSFSPFRSSKTYWVEDPKGELLPRYKEAAGENAAPQTPIFAELKFVDKGKATEGSPSKYDSVLEVVEMGAITPLTPENYRDR